MNSVQIIWLLFSLSFISIFLLLFMLIQPLIKGKGLKRKVFAYKPKTKKEPNKRPKKNRTYKTYSYLSKLITLSGSKMQVESFVLLSILFSLVVFLSAQFLLNMTTFSFLAATLAVAVPFVYLTNKKNRNHKSASKNMNRFIQSCLEAAAIYNTQRDVVLHGATGCSEPLQSIIVKYAHFKDIPIHESLYDLSLDIENRTLRLFAIILKKQESTGNDLYKTIDTFYTSLVSKEDTDFIRRLSLVYANSTFKHLAYFYLSDFVIYKFMFPAGLEFFYTPFGGWVLLVTIILVLINFSLLLFENVI